MPIYEYWCETCQKTFSKLQKMGAGEAETNCPECGGNKVTKQISACAIGGSTGGGGFAPSGPACGMGGG